LTVHRPGVDEVWVLRPVVTGVDVPVRGGDDRGILLAVGEDVLGDTRGNGAAAGHSEGAALTEVELDVHDDQCSAHASTVGPPRSPPDRGRYPQRSGSTRSGSGRHGRDACG